MPHDEYIPLKSLNSTGGETNTGELMHTGWVTLKHKGGLEHAQAGGHPKHQHAICDIMDFRCTRSLVMGGCLSCRVLDGKHCCTRSLVPDRKVDAP